jgi:deoxynucleoside triphosphate triphosphohydrolase SAMHD1
MSVERLLELKALWRKDRLLQNDIDRAFDSLGFSKEYVDRVTSPWFQERLPRKSKQLKDNQWGMIEFDWRAMRLIDSPVVQRLRYVKQLGFTYLTYPSAEHSRFSHTLGVGHVVSKFIEAIDKRAEEPGSSGSSGFDFVRFDDIPDLSADDVIHAALLHDIGHLPFSHVTERILESRPQSFNCADRRVSDVMFEANRILNAKVKFAEILTLMLILSERFEQFFLDFVRADDPTREDSLARIASLVVGLPPTPALAGLPELISSASVDADKVDYVNRDALNCGVPVGVDVARIFLRSGIVRASKEQIARLNPKDEFLPEEYLFVVNSSGIDTIDEILHARTALYQRVYFHAVTRTAERLLSLSLEANAADAHPDARMLDALKLWAQKDGSMLEQLATADLKNVQGPALRIINRQFPKKAYSFSPAIAGLQMPVQEILPNALEVSLTEIMKQVNNTTIEEYLRDEQLWKGTSKALEADIMKEAAAIVSALVAVARTEAVPHGPSRGGPPYVLIVGTAHEKQKRHNQIICQGDRLLTLHEYTNAREQQDAFELLKEVGFVLCDDEWRQIVFFAARVVLALLQNKLVDFELKFARGQQGRSISENVRYITRFLPDYSLSILRSGLSAKGVGRLASDLIKAGYFEDKPWACEPVTVADADVVSISKKLAAFDGYRSWRVTPASTAAFLSQFPPSLRKSMAGILRNNLKFVSAQECVDMLSSGLDALPQPVYVVPFTPSSGTQVWNWLHKEIGTANAKLRFVPDVRSASDPEVPIVFVDDNVSSGIQARAQFLSYLGVPPDEWPQECRGEDGLYGALDEETRAAFLKRQVSLMVCVGKQEADETISQCVRDAGLANFVGVRSGTQIAGDITWPAGLKAFLSNVGRNLIAGARYNREHRDLSPPEKEECDRLAFGYSNAAALVVTPISVPTATVTALWQPGLHNRQPWVPLAIRTNKLSRLVIG